MKFQAGAALLFVATTAFAQAFPTDGHLQTGKLKAFAVTGSKRMPDLPNVPAIIESGFPGFEVYGWIGIFAPAGTPAGCVPSTTSGQNSSGDRSWFSSSRGGNLRH